MYPNDTVAQDTRRAWVRPTLHRLRTADAEIAPRTATSDGAFSRAS